MTTGTRQRRARTVDAFAGGELSMEEIRLAFQPYLRVTDRVLVRCAIGAAAVHSTLDIEGSVSVNGASVSSFSAESDEWDVVGFAGLSLAATLFRNVGVAVGAEFRFPDTEIAFHEEMVSGRIELPSWSGFASLGLRF